MSEPQGQGAPGEQWGQPNPGAPQPQWDGQQWGQQPQYQYQQQPPQQQWGQYPNPQQYPNAQYPHTQVPNEQYPGQQYPPQPYPQQQYPGQQFPPQPWAGQQPGYPQQPFGGAPQGQPGQPAPWPPPQQSPQVPGNKKPLMWVGIGLVAVAAIAGVALSASSVLGAKTLDRAAAEQGVEQVVTDSYGARSVTGVSCPADRKVREDESFECTLTVDGSQKKVTVTFTDADGTYEVGRPR
ncbi:DUF4333 domain-containing protein [Prescottella sp. R16]|uniref:DUF4333 domain-containing protein n=1 Tax=Prescottella sp. R16 TaxID=3064529 RepID=UPI00272DED0D|nr:DUF4333 domain-containing protein [Prescottella sp. R16]